MQQSEDQSMIQPCGTQTDNSVQPWLQEGWANLFVASLTYIKLFFKLNSLFFLTVNGYPSVCPLFKLSFADLESSDEELCDSVNRLGSSAESWVSLNFQILLLDIRVLQRSY